MPSFRPSAHGWPFPDDYDCPAALIGLGRPVDPEFGLAGGLCWAALDRFVSGRRIPRTSRAPGPEDALYAEFILRLTNVLAKDVVARAHAAQRLPDEGRGRTLGRLAREEWARARKELDAGRPVLLLLIKSQGPFSDPTGNRFVLATRYDADSERAMVWVYDPRRPGDDAATIMLDPGKGAAAFVGRVGREEVFRGLLAVPYDRPVPPSIAVSALPRDDRQRVGLEEDIAPVALGSAGLGVLARDTDAHLVSLRHDDGGWQRERPADLGAVGADFRFEGRPVPAGTSGGRPSAVARGVNGHLLHFRKGSRGWSAEDLTDQPNTGLRFRIAGEPVVVAEGRHPVVLATNEDGRLLRYAWTTVRGWFAENLSKESGADPSTRLQGGVAGLTDRGGHAHAFGRNAEGEFVHFREESDGRWRTVRPGAARGEFRTLLLQDDPVATLAADGAIEVYSRGVADHLLRFRLPEGGRWTGQDLTEHAGGGSPSLTVASRPCVAGTSAGMRHVMGRNADGDVVQFVGLPDGGWSAENLTLDRITIGPLYRIEGQPQAAAGADTVLLAGRKGADLLLYRWHAGGAWTAENLTIERGAKDDGPRVASDPAMVCSRDAVHILALSSGGSLVEYRVDVAMGVGRRAGSASGVGGVKDWFTALVAQIRGLLAGGSRPAGGLRASPLPAEGADPDPASAADDAAEERIDAEAMAARLRSVSDEGAGGTRPTDPASEAAPESVDRAEESAAKGGDDWGHRASAAAPWHEEDDAGRVAHADDEAPRAPFAPDASTERDLLREGSEWAGPRLVPQRDAAPTDDWDRALEDVSQAHERAVVEGRAEEFVDEDDHASARIFLSPEREQASDAPPDTFDTAETAAPATPDTPPDEPRVAAASAAREPATDSVPGRPLVDLSFLSDIVPAEAGGAAHRGGAGPEAQDSSDTATQSPARPSPSTPPAPAVASASSVASAGTATAPGAGSPSTPVAAPDAGTPRNGHGPSALPSPVTAAASPRGAHTGAPARNRAAGGPPPEPVVDLDFLANAGEYLGGGESDAGMEDFLLFLGQG